MIIVNKVTNEVHASLADCRTIYEAYFGETLPGKMPFQTAFIMVSNKMQNPKMLTSFIRGLGITIEFQGLEQIPVLGMKLE